MQRIISIVFLLVMFGGNINAEFDSEKYFDMMQDPIQKIQLLFLRKCFRTANENEINNLLQTIDAAIVCGGIHNEIGSNNKMKDMLCSEAKNNINKCLQSTTATYNKCLDSEEIYFKQFLVNSIHAILNFICENDEPLLQTEDLQKCIDKVQALGVRPPTVSFDNFLQLFNNKNVSNIITKDQLCSELQIGRTCIIKMYQKLCPTESTWTTYIDDSFESILSATCK